MGKVGKVVKWEGVWFGGRSGKVIEYRVSYS